MSTTTIPATQVLHHAAGQRWRYLILAVVCMVMISNFQYGWSLFVLPLHNAHNWAHADIQVAFTIFVALATWATPFMGYIADKLGSHMGPRVVMGAGGILVALGWIVDSRADSLATLYLGSALTGLGNGAVYCTAVGTAVKWFTDHRGLAVGLVAGGFGAGSALSVIPIQMVISTVSYSAAFFWFGLIQGGIVLVVSQFIRNPDAGEAPAPKSAKVKRTESSFTTREMASSSLFWLLYVLFVLLGAGGLMVTASLAPLATSYNVADATVFLGASTISVALIFSNVLNGISRPIFGWLSDHIGVPPTMAIGFSLGALSYFCLGMLGSTPWAFIFFTGMVFFCWGEIYSLFPAICTDLFGPKYATTNSALLYTAKGAAGFLVPLGALATAATGGGKEILFLAAGVNVVAVLIVLLVLRPAVNRHHAEDQKRPADELPSMGRRISA